MTSTDATEQLLRELGAPFPEGLAGRDSVRLGLITDTHGLLRPQAVEALRGVDALLHTGDIGGASVLSELAQIAPIRAVRGNNDTDAWAEAIPETARFELGGCVIYAIHDRKTLEVSLQQLGAEVLICGHSHRPSIETEDGVLCINSGSAGPRRFSLPIGVATLELSKGCAQAELITLDL